MAVHRLYVGFRYGRFGRFPGDGVEVEKSGVVRPHPYRARYIESHGGDEARRHILVAEVLDYFQVGIEAVDALPVTAYPQMSRFVEQQAVDTVAVIAEPVTVEGDMPEIVAVGPVAV